MNWLDIVAACIFVSAQTQRGLCMDLALDLVVTTLYSANSAEDLPCQPSHETIHDVLFSGA